MQGVDGRDSTETHPGSRWAALLVFFLVVPLLAGLLLGINRAGVAVHFPWGVGVAFWIGAILAAWTSFYAGTMLADVLLRPWRPPLWLVLIAGAVVGSVVARYAINGLVVLLGDYMLGGRTPQPLPPLEASLDFILGFFQGWVGGYALWCFAAALLDRLAGFPRLFRLNETLDVRPAVRQPEELPPAGRTAAASPPAETAASPVAASRDSSRPAAPSIVDRLPERIGRNVLALEAEDHYVRVHTDRGSALILAKLSDAIDSLPSSAGLRVHRSWWVRLDAVVEVSVQGKGLLLKLTNEIEVPVSQGFKEIARQAGLSPTERRAQRHAVSQTTRRTGESALRSPVTLLQFAPGNGGPRRS